MTVLTPTLDAERYIGECLTSLGAQEYPSDRVDHIVLDGGSKDRTVEIIRAMAPATRIDVHPGSIYEALNRGLGLAHGEIVGWLNADDIFHPNAIADASSALTRHPDAQIAMAHFDIRAPHGLYTYETRVDALDRLRQGRRRGTWVFPLAVFFRTEFLRSMGGYSTAYRLASDRELWLRVASHQPHAKVVHTGRVAGEFRVHADSLTGGTDRRPILREVVEMYARCHADSTVPPGIRRHALVRLRQNALWLKVAEARGADSAASARVARAVMQSVWDGCRVGPSGVWDLVEAVVTERIPATRAWMTASRAWHAFTGGAPSAPD